MALCSRYPEEPNGTASLVTWAGYSRCIPCVGCVWPPVVTDVLIVVGWFLRMIVCEDWPWIEERSCCAGSDPMEKDSLWQWSGACPVGVLFVEVFGWSSGIVWSWPPGVLVLGPLEMSFDAGQCQLLPVLCLGPLGMSYKVICRWLPLVLVLDVSERDYAANWGQLPLVPGLGLFSKWYGVCWGQMLLVWGLWNFERF